MTRLSKVLWKEGMHLSQHHFQAQARFFEHEVHFALTHLFFAPHGLAGCGLDAEALRNGIVRLVHGRGIMPDGAPFQMPDGDPLPAPRAIGDVVSPLRDGHVVVLALPAYREGGANCAPGARYTPEPVTVVDEAFGRDECVVTVGRRNFRLLLDVEVEADPAGLVTLPLARVRRDGAGTFVYDDTFVPPCLAIGASDRLMLLLRRVVDVLRAKVDALGTERAAGATPGHPGQGDVTAFWFAHTINTALAPLQQLLSGPRAHPERMYDEFARLAGALCTFALDAHPDTVARYDHDRLGECFDALDRDIRARLELVRPTTALRVPLLQTAGGVHVGSIADRRATGPSRWFLGVKTGLAAGVVLDSVPRFVKVCSGRFVVELVKRALPGMSLTHAPSPPPEAGPRLGAHYFAVDTVGPCWEDLRKTAEVGIHLPEELRDAELDLVVILQ